MLVRADASRRAVAGYLVGKYGESYPIKEAAILRIWGLEVKRNRDGWNAPTDEGCLAALTLLKLVAGQRTSFL